MNTATRTGWKRRQFVIAALATGAAACGGAAALLWRAKDLGRQVVFRNPAFTLRREGGDWLLVCRDAAGRETCYRTDAAASRLWELTPTAEEYHFDGRRDSVAAILDRFAAGAQHRPGAWRRDALAFVREALQEGILLPERGVVRIAYTPPQAPAGVPM